MRAHKLERRSEAKSGLPLQGADRQSEKREAPGCIPPLRDTAEQVKRHLASKARADAHAAALHPGRPAESTRAQKSLLQLQRQYGNRYVQRVIALARRGDVEAEVEHTAEEGIEPASGQGRSLQSDARPCMESASRGDFRGVLAHTDLETDKLNPAPNIRSADCGRGAFRREGLRDPGSLHSQELLVYRHNNVLKPEDSENQPKLAIGKPGDKFEQEANRVADLVMGIPDPSLTRQPQTLPKPLPRRKPLSALIRPLKHDQAGFDKREKSKQGKLIWGDIPRSTACFESRVQSMRGQGQPLGQPVLSFFQRHFGYDFSRVRIHIGGQASEMAKAVGLHAFASGNDIIFAEGKYNPGSSAGKWLLGHELTHVVQQGKSYLGSRIIIQGWGPLVHSDLTKRAVRQIAKYDIDEEALRMLCAYSGDMDFTSSGLSFNMKAAAVIGQYKRSIGHIPHFRHALLRRPETAFPISKEEALNKLKAIYENDPREAKNHGEGGLYLLPKTAAAAVNLAHEMHYELDAWRAFDRLPELFSSYKECLRIKSSFRKMILEHLGNALHVAQDRGAHGEGAAEQGHAREIIDPSFDPDDKNNNDKGYKKAEYNTRLLVKRHFEKGVLVTLFDPNYLSRCIILQPEIVGETSLSREVQSFRRTNASNARSGSHASAQAGLATQMEVPIGIAQNVSLRNPVQKQVEESIHSLEMKGGTLGSHAQSVGNPTRKDEPIPTDLEELNWDLRISVREFVANLIQNKRPQRQPVMGYAVPGHFRPPQFVTNVTKDKSGLAEEVYYAKVRATESTEPPHRARYVAAKRYHVYSFDPLGLLPGVERRAAARVWRGRDIPDEIDVYVEVTSSDSDKCKAGEQEHLDDFHQAYLLSYAEIAEKINVLNGKGQLGPFKSEHEAKQSVTWELMKRLPKELHHAPKDWPKLLGILLTASMWRDFMGWHDVEFVVGDIDERGSCVIGVRTDLEYHRSDKVITRWWLTDKGRSTVEELKEWSRRRFGAG